ncbi:peptidoglycan DD-metalloendopeptidase family protein [Endozoicomonadaceae bacterium StTr2]
MQGIVSRIKIRGTEILGLVTVCAVMLSAVNPVLAKENLIIRQRQDHDLHATDYGVNVTTELPAATIKRIEGTIQGNFYRSGRAAGLSPKVLQRFVTLFQRQIDFSRDLRTGDHFEVLLTGTSGSNPELLAARLHLTKGTFTALKDQDGQFYTEDGLRLGTSFSRYPVGKDFRVSSDFNLRRVHPVTGKISPHKGTDWAVPVGTPVKATAAGVVVRAVKNHPQAGNYIEIKTAGRYVTRFLHLDSLNVKSGDRVKKGQIIGRSGNSGLSTGPHLHYEMYIDGLAVDVMKVRLPGDSLLSDTELAGFKARTEKLVVLMD